MASPGPWMRPACWLAPAAPALGRHAATRPPPTTPPCAKARLIAADARDLLGGNGILLDHHVIRNMADLEAIHTFEGTEMIQTLIVGRDITGVSAFA